MPLQPARVLTPEQLQLAALRRERRVNTASPAALPLSTPSLIQRPWSAPSPVLATPENVQAKWKFRIMSWNILAQTLVRRDLFPNSDCLKAAQRIPMIAQEILASDADIICLQEVDCLDKLANQFDAAGYDITFASGRRKKHGCVILHRKSEFTKLYERIIYYDEEVLEEQNNSLPNSRTAGSILTRNIGLILGLKPRGFPAGCIVATTHLFWHPKYVYERSRRRSFSKSCIQFGARQSFKIVHAILQETSILHQMTAVTLSSPDPRFTRRKFQLLMNPE